VKKRIFLYIKLIDRPVAIALLVSLSWYLARVYNFLGIEQKTDDSAMISSAITILGTFWAVFAAILIFRIQSELDQIERAIAIQHYPMFKRYCSKRTHPAIKMLFTGLSFIVIVQFFLWQNISTLVGVICVFSVAFIPALYIEVANDLDSPLDGIFNVIIPTKWMEKLKKENGQKH